MKHMYENEACHHCCQINQVGSMDSELLWGPGLVGLALPVGLSRAMVETREVSKLLMSTDYLSLRVVYTQPLLMWQVHHITPAVLL